MPRRILIIACLFVVCAGTSRATAQRAGATEPHDVIKPMAGSKPVGQLKYQEYAEMPIAYRDGSRTINKTVSGRYRYQEYHLVNQQGKRDLTRSAAEILTNYEQEAARVGGTVHTRVAGARLLFSLPRRDGGLTWCRLSAGAGSYALTIVDEAALKPTLTFGAEAWRDAIAKDGHVAVYGILFDTDRATLTPGSGDAIDEVARLLLITPDLRLEVQGHTDSTGSAARNRDLSLERARAVVAALALYGINAGRLIAKGHGADTPVADNATEEGRQKNRRVELVKQ